MMLALQRDAQAAAARENQREAREKKKAAKEIEKAKKEAAEANAAREYVPCINLLHMASLHSEATLLATATSD
jgi:sRNA-binding protein